MARGREGMAKRAREQRRQQRQEAKQVRRETIAAEPSGPDPQDEARLMEEFRLLSERHAAGFLSEAAFATERQRIFTQLGIETGED
ncbi:MAG TPA: hypothetical protein VIY70_04940 [Acidimicrobiia bacterium]|jgi:hypothetical protein